MENLSKFGLNKEMELLSLLKELEYEMSEYNRLNSELENLLRVDNTNDIVLSVIKKKFQIVAGNISRINISIKNLQKK